jgi:hypothetical protein
MIRKYGGDKEGLKERRGSAKEQQRRPSQVGVPIQVHSGASGARNIDTLFLMLRWYRYKFHKKRVGTRYAKLVFLHPLGYMGHIVHSSLFGA